MRWIVGILGTLMVVVVGYTYAQNRWGHGGMHHRQASLDADPIARGGRGYDKWWVEYELNEPTFTHQSYPATGKSNGADTWRCKECHGWDYRGEAGAYGEGSHFTGIKGITDVSGKPVAAVINVLRDETHGFDAVLPQTALEQIAKFAAEGQVDMQLIIDGKTSTANGDTGSGQTIFDENCSDCHGANGQDINFHSDGKPPEYVGTVARKNPWEALHKLRNGHPGAFVQGHMGGRGMGMGNRFMPPMRNRLTVQQQSNLLSYLQTLPLK